MLRTHGGKAAPTSRWALLWSMIVVAQAVQCGPGWPQISQNLFEMGGGAGGATPEERARANAAAQSLVETGADSDSESPQEPEDYHG